MPSQFPNFVEVHTPWSLSNSPAHTGLRIGGLNTARKILRHLIDALSSTTKFPHTVRRYRCVWPSGGYLVWEQEKDTSRIFIHRGNAPKIQAELEWVKQGVLDIDAAVRYLKVERELSAPSGSAGVAHTRALLKTALSCRDELEETLQAASTASTSKYRAANRLEKLNVRIAKHEAQLSAARAKIDERLAKARHKAGTLEPITVIHIGPR